jgi:hypothetical protein
LTQKLLEYTENISHSRNFSREKLVLKAWMEVHEEDSLQTRRT